jgi:hypothetical protein
MTNLHEFYTQTINNLTLENALIEHYKINPQFTPWYKFQTPEGQNLIKSHDISHLLYGCDTSYLDEYKVQMWNNFGSIKTLPKNKLKLIFNPDYKQLIKLVLPTGLIKFALNNRKQMSKVKKLVKNQSSQMIKKWEFFAEEPYMNKTISEIRLEYGIDIKT